MSHFGRYVFCNFLHKHFQSKHMILLFIILTEINTSNVFAATTTTSKRISYLTLNSSYIKQNRSYSTNENDYKIKVNWTEDEVNHPLKNNFDSYTFAKEFTTSVSDTYISKMDSLEKNLAAVLIKVAYGTTSTTKRSISDNSNILTTVATPLLTTIRYQEKLRHQYKVDLHYRNYELDLERDHALPTSAPNADILKSNNNPIYPNPNRRQNFDSDKYRHFINSTSVPSFNILKPRNTQNPTISTSESISAYLPPVRSFFTPPLPPEYQHPFADKPTLRGTNSEVVVVSNFGSFAHRRPIPPPSLMPGHERVPQRPLEFSIANTENNGIATSLSSSIAITSTATLTTIYPISHTLYKKNLSSLVDNDNGGPKNIAAFKLDPFDKRLTTINLDKFRINNDNVQKQILPGIKRILSGSNGRKDVPDVLFRHVTLRPVVAYHNTSSSIISLTGNLFNTSVLKGGHGNLNNSMLSNSNINKAKNPKGFLLDEFVSNASDNLLDYHKRKLYVDPFGERILMEEMSTTTIPATATFGSLNAKHATSPSISISTVTLTNLSFTGASNINDSSSRNDYISSSANMWNLAWNTHIYFSVIFFTILAVYSIYKMITFNKLTHLVTQSYFFCIHFILITICSARIFYLCYDAYNIHASFHVFISEIFLNLPSLLLTISFSVLILFLSLKSLNYKSNRYSALIRPLTVIIGSSVHVLLCITLHYVESYTLQNYQQQFLRRRQMRQQHLVEQNPLQYSSMYDELHSPTKLIPAISHRQTKLFTSLIVSPLPHRVLSLISRIIYIFVCFSLGLLYLYIYRILKRILMNKSQNYIHCYQNLSYAIHITIATALLFILLATLQIFGTVSISTFWPLIIQNNSEIDWLQWGYQFSLRLIEIAIITLLTWVTGLKTGGSGAVVNSNLSLEHGSDGLVIGTTSNDEFRSINSPFYAVKHNEHNSNTNGLFSQCNTSSNQNHFEGDYPTESKANANLRTYTLRTGKLIYGKKFAGIPMTNIKNSTKFQHLAYHHNENDSVHTSIRCDASKCDLRDQSEQHDCDEGAYYESPNFILLESNAKSCGASFHGNRNANRNINEEAVEQNFSKYSATSTVALSSIQSASRCNFSPNTSTNLQNQVFLPEGSNCYIEPMPTYEVKDFEIVRCHITHQQRLQQQHIHKDSLNRHAPTMFNKDGTKISYNASNKIIIN